MTRGRYGRVVCNEHESKVICRVQFVHLYATQQTTTRQNYPKPNGAVRFHPLFLLTLDKTGVGRNRRNPEIPLLTCPS